jgi:hypothetical protein
MPVRIFEQDYLGKLLSCDSKERRVFTTEVAENAENAEEEKNIILLQIFNSA